MVLRSIFTQEALQAMQRTANSSGTGSGGATVAYYDVPVSWLSTILPCVQKALMQI